LLGADVGSALVTHLLVVRQPFLIPLFILIGVVLFVRGQDSTRQIGRMFIGLALIFVSLDMIRLATGPMVTNPGTQIVMEYLSQDLVTAFLIGAAFAWVVQSSVASVLLFVTLAAQGILPPGAAAAMILGANLGGAFIAYVLTESEPLTARHTIVANLVLRGGGAITATVLVSKWPAVLAYLGQTPAQQSINLHLAFNVVLALVASPFVGPVTRILARIMQQRPDGPDTLVPGIIDLRSVI
jgi:phosphate:Na+ symporter